LDPRFTTFDQFENAVAGERIAVVVTDQQRRQLACAQVLEYQGSNLATQASIELGKWFIEQYGTRLGEQQSQQRYTGFLAAGQCRWIAFLEAGHADAGQRVSHLPASVRNLASKAKQQISAYRQVREQQGILEQQSDAAPFRGHGCEVAVIQQDTPTGPENRVEEAGDVREQRGLASTRWPEYAKHLSGSDAHVDGQQASHAMPDLDVVECQRMGHQ
jgi:hypothetical protein